ncbi:MAG TPA: CHAT domain-containing tetratricopeptide repeat protein [Vicinamibacterales bacterium]|nr:CHAT domain-containing tetratricopeptide repeat protein [Vicinamibacterales bacterium]
MNWRGLVLVLLLIPTGCSWRTERRLASLFDEATFATRSDELSRAKTIAERGAALSRPDSEWLWKFRLLRGEVLLLQRQPGELPALVSATLPPGPAFDPLRARQLYVAALLQRSQNRFADALATLERARPLASRARDVRFDIARLDGQLRMRLGQWADAEARLNAFVAEAAAAGDRFQQARALNDLGMGSFVRGRWDEALPRFERVVAFNDLEPLSIYAAALLNAGMCYARLGEFDRAVALQRRSVQLQADRGRRAYLAQALGELGTTLLQEGDPQQALPYLRQALAAATESNLQADAAVWAGNLASANIDERNWDEAERFNEEAKRLKTAAGSASLVNNTLNAAEIASGRGRLDEATRMFDQAVAGGASPPEVRWSAHAGLAGIAIAAGHPERAARQFEAALDIIEQTRAELLRTDYKLTFLTRLIRFYQSYVDALVDQGRMERALEISDSSRGRVLGERSGMAAGQGSAAALRQIAARSRSVLLSYWLGPARSYVWVVVPGGVKCLRLPPAGEIATLVRQYRTTITNGFADPLTAVDGAADRLYRLLVEPVSRWIPKGSRVVIAADGALHGLNFETLPVPGARRHYWIEDVVIETAPSLSMLAAPAPPPDETPSLLLFGDPAPREPEFPALRYAAAEITNISRHFPAGGLTTYVGGRASPAAYRAAGPDRFTFVHFTAHAAANFASPLDSAVILSGPNDAYKLYARDVAELPLRAELVTVSACRSAGERAYSGEGLVGFAWAFLRAGARRVIAGLWDVDDRSTAEMMDALYARIAAGDGVPRALRAAKLGLIARGGNYRKPYYWAPFQVFTSSGS